MKVLLVEDHEPVAKSTVMLLRLLKHEVTHAKTGKEAIEQAILMKPDICLIDIGLPDMSGHHVATQLRMMPEFSTTIMVALTGYDCQEKAMESGFNHYCKKPMDFDILPKLVLKTA